MKKELIFNQNKVKKGMEEKLFFWLVCHIPIQIGVPILFYFYLDALLDFEYAHGIRTSTDGDTIIIPVLGMAIFVFISLVVIDIILFCYCFWIEHKNSRKS